MSNQEQEPASVSAGVVEPAGVVDAKAFLQELAVERMFAQHKENVDQEVAAKVEDEKTEHESNALYLGKLAALELVSPDSPAREAFKEKYRPYAKQLESMYVAAADRSTAARIAANEARNKVGWDLDDNRKLVQENLGVFQQQAIEEAEHVGVKLNISQPPEQPKA